MTNKKTFIKTTLLGATGLIGSHVLKNLIEDKSVSSITVIVRRKTDFDHPKVKEVVIDFKDENAFQNAIEPESVIFCAVGTTNKKVKGNTTKYRAVDYDIPVKAAQFGIEKDCQSFVLVSSMGANPKSSNFYTKLKGEVEEEISGLGYQNLYIFRPSLLLGKREEFRFGEKLAKFFMGTFSFLLPSKIKPIQAKYVANAMVKASKVKINATQVYRYKDIIRLSQ